MSRLSITMRSISAATAVLVLVGVASPADAAGLNEVERPIAGASRTPWPAPVGHRQPRVADIPQSSDLSAWEREQQQLDAELDRKLIICRGC